MAVGHSDRGLVSRLLLGTTDFNLQLVDSETVQVLALIQHRSPDLRRTVPDPTGALLMSLTPTERRDDVDDNGKADDLPAHLTVIPMPGHDVVLPD